MAGQAGWYRAPGEEGLLRYWNGSAWTEHRQPAPVTVEALAPVVVEQPAPVIVEQPAPVVVEQLAPILPAMPSPPVVSTPQVSAIEMPAAQRHLASEPLQPQPAAIVQATEPDWSMDQFEKQFEEHFGSPSEPNQSNLPEQATGLDEHASAVAPQTPAAAVDPYAVPVSRFAPPTVLEPTPVQEQPVPVAAPVPGTAAATDGAPKPSTSDIAFAASTATADVERVKRNRKRVVNPVRGMIAGLVFILVGVALIFLATTQNNPPSGELKAAGIITSLGSPKVGCSPVARFAAAGGSYTTAQGAAISPCPVGLGQSVNVFYSLRHPGTTGTISSPSSISTIDWAIACIGVLLLIGSGVLFIARTGSVSRGVAVIRDGELAEVAASKNRP